MSAASGNNIKYRRKAGNSHGVKSLKQTIGNRSLNKLAQSQAEE
jgi:hypothetical protein